MITSFSIRL